MTEGRLPAAIQTDKRWEIPLEALLAAGFVVDRPAPATEPATSTLAPVKDPARVIADLRSELATERARRELETVRREAAETQAADRATHIDDLRSALLMLAAANPAPSTPDQPPTPVGNQVANRSTPVAKTSWWHRRREQ